MTDPFARLPTVARLWAAAVLCVVPLGLVWSRLPGTVTPGLVGPGSCDADGFCTPGIYTPGIYYGGGTVPGASASARVLLVAAAVALVVVAVRLRTDATRRVARLTTVAVGVAAALAAADRATGSLLCLLAALALVAPLVWRLPRIRGRDGSVAARFGA